MIATELAWAAGFIDGEGCIHIGKRGSNHVLIVKITQKDRRPLDALREMFGGSLFLARSGVAKREYWNLVVQSAQAAVLLAQVRPYLVLKAEQADVALSFQARRREVGVRDALTGRFLSARSSERDAEDYATLRHLKVVT